jgi:hypothetical protein
MVEIIESRLPRGLVKTPPPPIAEVPYPEHAWNPITHFLTGACLARAGFNRKAAYATLAMTLAAEMPDLDTLWGFRGPVAAFSTIAESRTRLSACRLKGWWCCRGLAGASLAAAAGGGGFGGSELPPRSTRPTSPWNARSPLLRCAGVCSTDLC